MEYSFLWSTVTRNIDYFYRAIINTSKLAIISIILSLIFGVLFAIIKHEKITFISQIINAYIVIIRSTPLLVQLYFIFFGLPHIGIIIPSFWCGVIALTLNSGGYIAEIVRGGLNSIPKGHLEAAQALGLNKIKTLRYIILPQTLKKVVSPIIGQFTILVKDTSILAAVGIYELTNTAKMIHAKTFRPLEPFLFALLLYLIINFILMYLGYLSNKKLSIGRKELS